MTIHNPWQFDPDRDYSDDLPRATCAAAELLQQKAMEGPGGKKLTPNMDPDVYENEIALKDAFWGYNGRADFSNYNQSKGCTPNIDGHADWDWDCSGYVTSGWDSNHLNFEACGTDQGAPVCQTYTYDGTWKIYYMLYHSTYGPDGKLLVYGGNCVLTTGVVNGLSIPTKSGLAINSQFFVGHIGIDIANAEGDPVFAIADGDVANSGWSDAGGYYILQHIPVNVAGNTAERWVWYGHLDPNGLPTVGSTLKAGQQIAKTGPHMVEHNGQTVTNGDSSGPHLHFDIRTISDEDTNSSGHVNPCSIDLFKQSYPTLQCNNEGVSWK
jgi:hypothetical protein